MKRWRAATFARAAVLVTTTIVVSAVAARAGDPWPCWGAGLPLEKVLAQAKETGKLALLEFTTRPCVWCERLQAETISRPEVERALQGFVWVWYDAALGQGGDLRTKYRVCGFPTSVVVDEAGDEVDRLVGFMPPDAFLKEVERIRAGERTLKSLRADRLAHPTSAKACVAYGRKLIEACALSEGVALLSATLTSDADDAVAARPSALDGLARAAVERGDRLGAIDLFAGILKDHPESAEASGAHLMTAQLYAQLGDLEKAESAIARGRAAVRGDDRSALEQLALWVHVSQATSALVAWAEAEMKAGDARALRQAVQSACARRLALEDAVGWARKAVDLSGRDPDMLSTLANVLFENDRLDEAIAAEEESLEKTVDPDRRADRTIALAHLKAAREAEKAGAPVGPVASSPAALGPVGPKVDRPADAEGGGAGCPKGAPPARPKATPGS